MAIDIYEQVVPVMQRMLHNLSAILTKAEKYAEERKIDPTALLQSRLFPDMFTFTRQIQIATDFTKSTPARLAGIEPPKWDDTEKTFPELQARIQRGIDYLGSFRREQFIGAETRAVEFKTPRGSMNFNGRDFLLNFALPNFYFHATMAYALLRHNGLDLGKTDFIGK
jgi:hypothetical protein